MQTQARECFLACFFVRVTNFPVNLEISGNWRMLGKSSECHGKLSIAYRKFGSISMLSRLFCLHVAILKEFFVKSV